MLTSAPSTDAAQRPTLANDAVQRPTLANDAKARLLGRLWGVWLGLFPALDFIFRPPLSRDINNFDQVRNAAPQLAFALVSLALSGALISTFGAATFGIDLKRAKYFAFPALLLCLSVPLSYLPLSDTSIIVYIILIYNLFAYNAVSISTNVDRDALLAATLSTVAVAHALMMIAVLIDHDYSWGRLYGRNAPNYWGFVAQTVICATIAMRGRYLRLALIGLSLAVMYLTQSRGSMVAVVTGLSVVLVLFSLRSRARIWVWLAVGLAIVAIVAVGSNFVADDLLQLSAPGRGLGSGVSGRANVWRETWELFSNHPWFGVGYRQHEQYLTSEASAHNAYLATLADTGVVGFFGFAVFLFGGLWRLIGRQLVQPSRTTLASIAFLTAFAVNGLFERSALNTGNAYCQVMVMLTAWAWRCQSPAVPRRSSWS
jgi:O-antigen ligase